MAIGKRTFQSAGQISQHLIPGAYSRIDSIKGTSGLVPANNGVLMGQCEGGQPNTLLQFNSVSEAVNTLKKGPLMEAVRQAFNPGNDLTPQRLFAMRVNSAVAATLNLKNVGSQNLVLITSRDWGLAQNQINLKMEAGTTGKKITINYKTAQEIFDNIIRNSIVITHATATVTIVNNSAAHTLTLSVGPVAIDLATYRTIGDLAAYINNQAGYTAAVVAGQENADTWELDSVSAISLTGGYTAQSTMEAIIDTLTNQSLYVKAAANNGANNREIPQNIALTYLTSGTEGAYTSTEWTNALIALEAESIQFISTPDNSGTVHAAIKAHCMAMNAVTGRKERQFLVGGVWGTVVATAKSNAIALNEKSGLYVFNGYTQYDNNLVIQNFDAAYMACLLLGMKVAGAINLPLTAKQVNVISLEDKLTDSELEQLIENGVCPINYNASGLPEVIRQVNTYQVDDLKFNEFSMVTEMFYISRDLRAYVESLYKGKAGNTINIGVVKGAVEVKLTQYTDLGLLTRDKEGISYWAVQISIVGDSIYVDYDANITAPINFQFVTQHFHELVSVAA